MPWALGARRSTREARASNARAMRGSEQRHVRVRQGSLLHAVGGGRGASSPATDVRERHIASSEGF